MSKVWRVVGFIVLIFILLGLVFMGVGLMTGADFDRIYSVLDGTYHIDMWLDYGNQVIAALGF